MKKVEAVIRPYQLDEVKEALAEYGINGMTVTEVAGCGLQKGHINVYRGQEYSMTLLPKLKVEIVAADEKVPEIVDVIIRYARTGQIGDGKIFVSPVEEAYRIRTGETGNDAL